MTWDPAHDERARRNRTIKAVAIATWCWQNGYDPAVVVLPAQRRQIERKAGVRRCSDETWAEAGQGFDWWRRTYGDPPKVEEGGTTGR